MHDASGLSVKNCFVHLSSLVVAVQCEAHGETRRQRDPYQLPLKAQKKEAIRLRWVGCRLNSLPQRLCLPWGSGRECESQEASEIIPSSAARRQLVQKSSCVTFLGGTVLSARKRAPIISTGMTLVNVLHIHGSGLICALQQ